MNLQVMEELCNVLTPELAYEAYSVFARYFGESFMQRSLINLDFIQQLCTLYKEERQLWCHSKSGNFCCVKVKSSMYLNDVYGELLLPEYLKPVLRI